MTFTLEMKISRPLLVSFSFLAKVGDLLLMFLWFLTLSLLSLFSSWIQITEKLQGCNGSLHCVVLYFSLCLHLWLHLWPNLVTKLPQALISRGQENQILVLISLSWKKASSAKKWQHLKSPHQRMASMSSKERCSWLSRRWDGVQDGRPIFRRSVSECSKLVFKNKLLKCLAMFGNFSE